MEEKIIKVRTIKQTASYIKELDMETAITERAIRRAVAENKIAYTKVGNKTLLNVDSVIAYFSK